MERRTENADALAVAAELRALAQTVTERGGQYCARAHIRHGPINAYVRVGVRVCQGEPLPAVTLADVSINQGARGQGVFAALLVAILAEARALGLAAVVVENVIASELLPHLRRHGFDFLSDRENPLLPSLFCRV